MRPDAPVLLILHGLEGSSRSHYAVGLAREALARGWRAVVLNFRSCSGELNRRPQFYHSGHTDDLDDVVRGLVAREPATRLAAVGVSLGGNVLLKWLGEREANAPAQLVGAVAISAPFDLVPCARGLDQGLRRRVYTAIVRCPDGPHAKPRSSCSAAGVYERRGRCFLRGRQTCAKPGGPVKNGASLPWVLPEDAQR